MDPNLLVADHRDFSILGLIQHADPFVQAIMLLLAVCSVGCWALTWKKPSASPRRGRRCASSPTRPRPAAYVRRQRARRRGHAGRAKRMGGGLFARGDAHRAARAAGARHASAMKRELKRIEFGLPFLATVGSASPFVGLFGTVWGIMHSFTSIAQAKDTSLAVVAPGIAEALFATALGLAAAIPRSSPTTRSPSPSAAPPTRPAPASPRWPRPSPAARARARSRSGGGRLVAIAFQNGASSDDDDRSTVPWPRSTSRRWST